ncbi:MAG: TlyA family RNA methyltransferase [Verrucomicrobiota bacterium]|nr:TlyA family RNA methyltransferase [Verrucomicrobiota bacterium]
MSSERLDILLVERGLTESRAQAHQLILAGQVLVDGHALAKPGHKVRTDAAIEVKEGLRYVSRGGLKLEAALDAFRIEVKARVCADIGASTGGFTDCLLQRGAARVCAIDVGKGLLHWKLRNDPRVTAIEGVNARYLEPARLPEKVSLAVVDVSFISLTKILPAVLGVMTEPGELVTLIKPQFEAGRKQVGKGGVVKDAAARQAVVDRIRDYGINELGLDWGGVCESPIKGLAGNVEFLAYWRKGVRCQESRNGEELSGG